MNAEYWQRLVKIFTQGDLPVKEGEEPLRRGRKYLDLDNRFGYRRIRKIWNVDYGMLTIKADNDSIE